MLPFLNKHKQSVAGLIIERRKPDEGKEQPEEHPLEMAAKDLLSAIDAKDHRGVATAIRAAFDILESEPHEEVEHEENQE